MSEHNKKRVRDFFLFLNKLKLSTYSMNGLKADNFLLKHKRTSPLGRTERKARTSGLKMYGVSCYQDSATFFAPDTPWRKKLQSRRDAGLCIGCGNKPQECRCKRKAK